MVLSETPEYQHIDSEVCETRRVYLDKANVLGVLPEALSANVQAILPDKAPLIGANTAATESNCINGLSSSGCIAVTVTLTVL